MQAVAAPVEPSTVSEEQAPVAAPRASFALTEQVNNSWRHVAEAGTTVADLESGGYLSAIAEHLSDWDRMQVILGDRARWFDCLVIQGGRDGLGGVGSGRARMIVVNEHAVPPIDRTSNDGLPDGYRIEFDGFRNVHIPKWGERALSPDGFPQREDARAKVVDHAKQAARTRQPR